MMDLKIAPEAFTWTYSIPFRKSRSKHMKKKAFSLIELLVTIALITVLVGILLPALSEAREHAKEAMCATQQKRIYQGYQLYSENNQDPEVKDYLWEFLNLQTNTGFVNQYTGSQELWLCPGDRKDYINQIDTIDC